MAAIFLACCTTGEARGPGLPGWGLLRTCAYARPRSTRLESSVRPKFLSIINDTVGFLRLGTLVAAAYDL